MSDETPKQTSTDSQAQQAPTVETKGRKTQCPKCQSVERERYHRVRSREISGVTRDGQPYSRVTWRRTRCKSCGQNRIDIEHTMSAVPSDSP